MLLCSINAEQARGEPLQQGGYSNVWGCSKSVSREIRLNQVAKNMRSPWINEVIRLSNSVIPHFIDRLSTNAAITLYSCGYNNTERRGEEWEWRWSALEQCIKFNKHDYAGAYQAHSCLQPPLTKHRQPQPSETENTERLWIEIQYVSSRWTGMFCWKKKKKKGSAELTRDWCALSSRLIRTSALLLSLHSFTSDTER